MSAVLCWTCRLIHHVNADGRVNVFYSTPAAYVAAKASYDNVSWPVKSDDFFPYADCAHCYWTGKSNFGQRCAGISTAALKMQMFG
jgi:7-cyano-7-deazaguanine synthase in queuosine biosynthesis